MRWLWVLLGVLAAVVLAVAVFPMRWVTDRYVPDLEADAVEGSIWNARFRNARFQGVPLGDVVTGLSFRDLFGGRATLGFQKLDGAVAGAFFATRTVRGVERVMGSFVLPVLPAPLPPVRVGVADGAVALNVAGQCQSASGRVTTRIEEVPRLGTVPLLEGDAQCDGPDLLLPMTAPNGMAKLTVRVVTGGRWSADFGVPAGNALRATVLAAMGFRLEDGWMMWQVASEGPPMAAG